MDPSPVRSLLVLPTYNEIRTVEAVLKKIFEAMPDGLEVLVVDDNSPDGTAEAVRNFSSAEPRIHLLSRAAKTGLGDAYIAGFRWGLERDYDMILEMDADLSHNPADIPRLISALSDADLSIGSRYVAGGATLNWDKFRLALSRNGNRYCRMMLRMNVQDCTSGFRAYRRAALASQDLDSVASHGYAFQIEMARRVHLAGGKIVEVPITFTERAEGVSKMSKRIVVEALWQVTKWGIQDRLRPNRSAAVKQAG
jgi:dolichol-phosphate mannosyltransferase